MKNKQEFFSWAKLIPLATHNFENIEKQKQRSLIEKGSKAHA